MGRGDRVARAAGGEYEGQAQRGKRIGDRPAGLAAAQVDVQDHRVDAPGVEPGERVGDRIGAARGLMAERFEEVLEHHRDERLILDDEDASASHHFRRFAEKPLRAKRNFSLPQR